MAAEWSRARLRDVATLVRGISYRSSELGDHPDAAAFLNLKCVARGGGYRPDGLKFYRGSIKPELHVRSGDLLMAVTDLTQARDVVGCPVVVPDPLPRQEATFSLDLVKIIPDPSVVASDYLAYMLRSPQARRFMRSRSTGTTVLHLSPDAAGDFEWEVPPLDEQRRITGLLGALDDLIKLDASLISSMLGLSDVAYQRALRGAHETVRFADIAVLARDAVKPRAVGPDTPYLGLEHFGEGGRGVIGVGRAADTESTKSRFNSGDVLYGKLRPYFRKVDRPGFGGVCSTEIWVLRPQGNVAAAFLHFVTRQQSFTDWAMSGSGGTRMPRANWDHVATYPVKWSDNEAIRRTSEQAEVMWQTINALHEEIEQALLTRDLLLPLLLSGRVSPSEVAV